LAILLDHPGPLGKLYLDDPGVSAPFLATAGFSNTYADMGRADAGYLIATAQVQNTFVTAGGRRPAFASSRRRGDR